MSRSNQSFIFLALLSVLSQGCKTKRGGARSTAEEQCMAARHYTWLEGACRLIGDVEREKRRQECLYRSHEYAWINGECVKKDLIQSPRERCESANDGSHWQVDPKTSEGACIGPAGAFSNRDECLAKVAEGYSWEDGRCFSPAEQRCLVGGDIPALDGRCITVDENSCLQRNDGSRWLKTESRCKTADEISCEQRGLRYTWNIREMYCRDKTLLDFCKDRSRLPEGLSHTLSVLLSLNSVRQDNCEEAVRDLNAIRSLALTGKKIVDLTPLALMKNLVSLDLQMNHISDITALKDLKHLIRLNLAGNRIENITPLASLRALKELSLTENRIADLSALAGLNHLETLYLKNNRIRSIRILLSRENQPGKGLESLETLNLSENCGLQDVHPLMKLKKLKDLSLQNTGVQKIPAFRPGIQVFYTKCP